MHGCLQVLWLQELDVDLDMLWKAANKKVRPLAWVKIARMTDERIEALLVVLDYPQERKARQLREAIRTDRRPEIAELHETFP